MRFNPSVGQFVDHMHSRAGLNPPQVLFKATANGRLGLGYGEVDTLADYRADAHWRNSTWVERAASPTKSKFRFRSWVGPTGMADVTLGTLSEISAGPPPRNLYTPTLEGRLIGWDGVLTSSASFVEDCAGMLLTDYFYRLEDNVTELENGRITVIEEGDILWLAWRAKTELYCDGAATEGDLLMFFDDGKVTVAPALDDTTATTLMDTGVQRSMGFGGQCVGRALETTLASGLVLCELLLPERMATP